MPNLQNFLEDSDQADLLHRGRQGEIGRLCFVKEINLCRGRSFSDGFRASFASLNTLPRIISLKRTRKKSVQPGTNWLSQCCDCMIFLPLTFLASAQKKVSTWLTILPAP